MSRSARRRYDAVKRALDACAAAVALVVTAPVQVSVAVAVRAALGPPVLFRQARAGRGGVPFTLVKFRTMAPQDPERGATDDAERLTRLGAWLRSTSLDELPTLWNVVRGDMSLVGPRPLLARYLACYTPEQHRRHEVRPGITGLAQVRGRNELPWGERLALDVRYVDCRSLAVDLRILARTPAVVLRRSGISQPGRPTMTPLDQPAAS